MPHTKTLQQHPSTTTISINYPTTKQQAVNYAGNKETRPHNKTLVATTHKKQHRHHRTTWSHIKHHHAQILFYSTPKRYNNNPFTSKHSNIKK